MALDVHQTGEQNRNRNLTHFVSLTRTKDIVIRGGEWGRRITTTFQVCHWCIEGAHMAGDPGLV